MNKYKISLIEGDGIGPELTKATLAVLDSAQANFDLKFDIVEAEAGDATFQKRGVALPDDTIEKIKASHACLKGPVGETAADVIVKLRLMFDLYANLRPIKSYPKSGAARPDIDMYFVRENTEDLYKGLEFSLGDTTVALRVITRKNTERIARKGFEIARRKSPPSTKRTSCALPTVCLQAFAEKFRNNTLTSPSTSCTWTLPR